MSGHTPGPWTVCQVWPTGCTGFAIRAETKEHSVVSLGVYEHGSVDGSFSKAEADANARLIAAAPELLEALQGIIEIGKRDLSNPKYDGFFTTARAVIARATGGGND